MGAAAETVVILAAGQGTRMRTSKPKVLAELCGRPMLAYVVEGALALEPQRVLIVIGKGADEVREKISTLFPDAPIEFVLQEEQLGTGHAVQCCSASIETSSRSVLILYGDMPLLRAETLKQLQREYLEHGSRASLLTVHAQDPRGFGRVIRSRDASGSAGGALERIVEERDASPEQLALREVNVGVYLIDTEELLRLLPTLQNNNAQGEYYLTDIVHAIASGGGGVQPVVVADPEEAIGVNTLRHLAEARRGVQDRILERHLAAGVFIEDPDTTFVDWDVEIGTGTRILPCTVIRSGVKIGEGCEVGPFSHLRVGSVLDDGAEIGNFTETKKAHVGAGTKAKHLSYLGDVSIGSGANIGAGTIVANYDGVNKHHTDIGDRAFVGSGSVIIAPSTVGADATIGGGAVLTGGSVVPPGDVWIGVPAESLAERKAKKDRGLDPSTEGAKP